MSKLLLNREILPHTFARFRHLKQEFPQVTRYIFGLAGLSFAYGIKAKIEKVKAQNEINYRKQQLSRPVYELRDDELVHPPWNASNMQEWLHRPIRIRGRPIHGRAMYIPRNEYQQMGFEYVVPFVTKENEDQTIQQGVLLSLGFIPFFNEKIANRSRLEDASFQIFDCFVSQLEELQAGSMTSGNTTIRRNHKWNWADLNKMAITTGFTNANEIKTVVLEHVALDTPCDENNVRIYDVDAGYQQPFPYRKTRSGALYWHNHMPWDWQKTSNLALSSSVLFGALGSILYLLK